MRHLSRIVRLPFSRAVGRAWLPAMLVLLAAVMGSVSACARSAGPAGTVPPAKRAEMTLTAARTQAGNLPPMQTAPTPDMPATLPPPSPYPAMPTIARSASRTPLAYPPPGSSPVPQTPPPTEVPRPLATTVSSLPSGLKIVYAYQTYGIVTLWAVNLEHPELRQAIFNAGDDTNPVSSLALAHHFATLAYTVRTRTASGYTNELWLADLASGERRQLAEKVAITSATDHTIWSPDDGWIAFKLQTTVGTPGAYTLAAVDTRSGQVVSLTATSEGATPLDWSPDGRLFYYVRVGLPYAQLWRTDTAQGNLAQLVRQLDGTGLPNCSVIAPDGSAFAYTFLVKKQTTPYEVQILPTDPSLPERTIDETGVWYEQIFWHPSEAVTTLVRHAPGVPGEIHLYGLSPDQDRIVYTRGAEQVLSPGPWAPNGQWLLLNVVQYGWRSMAALHVASGRLQAIPETDRVEYAGWLEADLP